MNPRAPERQVHMGISSQAASPVKKAANALIADAKPGFEAYLIPLALDGIAGAVAFGTVLAAAKKLSGGLWVGGEVELTTSTIEFRPNAANKFLHKGNYKVSLPLHEITGVRNDFGFFTGIIRLETACVTLKLRVYGAKEFSEQIRSQVATVGADASRGSE